MDSFELSKIAGAVFAALLLIFVPKTIIEMRQKSHEQEKPGYTLPVPVAATPAAPVAAAAPAAPSAPGKPAAPGSKTAAAPVPAPAAAPPVAAPAKAAAPAAEAAKPEGFDAKSVVALLGAASADNGKATFSKCLACHSADKGGANKVGPNLWNLVGRKKGAAEGFSYSPVMKAKGGEWVYEDLASFIHSPAGWLSGTKMSFPGIKDPAALADLLAYVRTLADTPAALPK